MPGFAPKLRILSPSETQTSLEVWKETLLFHLTLDGSFEEFLEDDAEWKSSAFDNRGLLPDDSTKVAEAKSSKQKATILKLMLGTIASYAPVISREFIVSEALSLEEIWTRLRIHYGVRKSGGLILDLASLDREDGESYEGLWERLYAFVADNLLQSSDGMKHKGAKYTQREEMTPTMLNIIVTLWLKTINPALPAAIKQRYSTQLRDQTLVSIREEISESLDAIMSEVSGEGACIARASYSRGSSYHRGAQRKGFGEPLKSTYTKQRSSKFCPLCEACRRSTDHFLSECPFLPESDKRFMSYKARARAVEGEDLEEEEETNSRIQQVSVRDGDREWSSKSVVTNRSEEVDSKKKKDKSRAGVRKVDVVSSPYIWVKYGKHDVPLTIDTAAETDVMKHAFAVSIGAPISKTTIGAVNADGKTDLKTVGEVHLTFLWENRRLQFNGLVVEDLSDKVLAGGPFMTVNDVYARPAKQLVYIGDRAVPYNVKVRSSKAVIMRIPRQKVLLPGETARFQIPESLKGEDELAIEPRNDARSLQVQGLSYRSQWLQPEIVKQEGGHVELINRSSDPVLLHRHEQIAMIRPVVRDQDLNQSDVVPEVTVSNDVQSSETRNHLDVVIDPDKVLSQQQREQFKRLHERYKEVFDDRSLGLYNGASGPLEVKINMGPTLPPQRKGRMPLYNRSLKEEYQQVCDKLEGTVLLKPEEVGVTCEYLNPSFLIKKKSGKKRLVTAFTEVAQYTKPQPALMSDVEGALRHIANWSDIVVSDLTSAYWQMPLSEESMKYTGVATPFKGIRVYGRGAMGMPGTESALEELMCRILGEQLASGGVAKVADDLYCGGSSPEEALREWERILKALDRNGMRLSASKTVICPQSIVILGWVWSKGTIKASPHRISALTAVDPLSVTTVGQLRSFIGSFKFLSRVLKSYSEVLSPLEEEIAGRSKAEKIKWTDSLLSDFKRAQSHLSTNDVITIPHRSDQLKIITDASSTGIGAALYVIRKGGDKIAGHFSAKLKKHQALWLPCEIESLAITAAVNHFAPNIVNSDKQTMILTDSLPSVQAFGKLKRGQFSSSSRVSTFLSTISRYNVYVAHLKGSENVYSDYASRNAVSCTQKRCQICTFVAEIGDSVIGACTVKDVLESGSSVPFSSRSGWHEMQVSDDALRRTCAHLKQGTTPSRKSTSIGDVKRYLQVARVARDGLLVVESHSSSLGRTERIVVPRVYLHGLLECLHLTLEHPTRNNLRKVFNRSYYALNLDDAVEAVFQNCHVCVSLSDMPNKFMKQSMTTYPSAVGSNYSADIVTRYSQPVLFIREYVTSYSQAKLVRDEKASTMREGLIMLTSELIPKSGPKAIIKVDPASACRSLVGDTELLKHGIVLELGQPKYKNKNPVGERGIRELHSELNRVLEGTVITARSLAMAVASLNSRLRREGLSAWEMWTHRCQFTGSQLPVEDLVLISSQECKKKLSHTPSATSKARGKSQSAYSPIRRGQLVYINSDRSKLKKRDRYIVKEVEKDNCKVQKFTGHQLRARVYTVHRGDILIVTPWEFPDENGGSEDEEEEAVHGDDLVEVHGEEAQEGSDSEDIEVVEPELHQQEVVTRSRRGRTINIPGHLKDYVLE